MKEANVNTNEELEILTPNGKLLPFVLRNMQNEAGEAIAVAPHAQMIFSCSSDVAIPKYSLVRRLHHG